MACAGTGGVQEPPRLTYLRIVMVCDADLRRTLFIMMGVCWYVTGGEVDTYEFYVGTPNPPWAVSPQGARRATANKNIVTIALP